MRQVVKYLRLKEEKEVRQKIADKPLLNAQQKANQIVSDAVKKSEEILRNTKFASKVNEEKLAEKLKEATQKYADVYGQAMEILRSNVIKMIGNTPNDIKAQVAQEVEAFKVQLQQQLTNSQQIINQKLEQGYAGANQEIERYKKARARRVDESILKIIEYVSQKVLEKEIRVEEHEKLVIKALEEAKRQHSLDGEEARIQKVEDRGPKTDQEDRRESME